MESSLTTVIEEAAEKIGKKGFWLLIIAEDDDEAMKTSLTTMIKETAEKIGEEGAYKVRKY